MNNLTLRYTTNPGYGDLVADTAALIGAILNDPRIRLADDFRNIFCPSYAEIVWCLAVALSFTWIRYLFQRFLNKSVIERLGIDSPSCRRKLPESSWKLLVYSCLWAYCYLMLSYQYDYLSRPMAIWDDWSACMPIPLDIRVLYCVECGFYLHSIYATLYMDERRKDFIVMLCHHVLTLILIIVSYTTRYHKIGIMVIFVHDVTDILLEMTKCHAYLKQRDGKEHAVHDHLSKIGFVSFAAAWFIFRLYWFPVKLLYSASVVSGHRAYHQGASWYTFFNALLWALFAMDLYWFYFVVLFLYKIATKQLKELTDTREYETVQHCKAD